jgi:hypothetical protein
MELSNDQEIVLKQIIEFIYKPIKEISDVAGIMCGAAGCGKTFLTKIIVSKIRQVYRIAGVAPTHKARKILEDFLNKNQVFYLIQTMTIASLLNKIRSHSYIGTKNYIGNSSSKMNSYDLLIIDEASMINDLDVDLIINYAYKLKKKILFIGDNYQIPNPVQKYICKNGKAIKKDSKAFELKNKFVLYTNMRQINGNPIIEIYDEIRKSIEENREIKIKYIDKINEIGEGIKYYKNYEEWWEKIIEEYKNYNGQTEKLRILTYTNDCVRNNNMKLRRLMKKNELQVGEILMGYNNVGYPEKIIENSQDYYVEKVEQVNNYKINVCCDLLEQIYENLVGNIIIINDYQNKKSKIFIPNISDKKNNNILQELIKRAEKVNQKGSTKKDYNLYTSLKDKLIFMENIYKYNGEIISESEFKIKNPLLFKSVAELIKDTNDGNREIKDNKLSKDIISKYGNIIQERICDDKPITIVEKFSDKYCVIEKDIDYGYCITAHKSQGSTYNIVFIEQNSFEKLYNYWSYDLDCEVDTLREKNQLKYVCYTRPKKIAYVYIEE